MSVLPFIRRFFVVFFLTYSMSISGQSCKEPFAISFSDRTATSIKVRWADTNISPIGWEIELRKKGETRTGQPNLPLILQSETTLQGLTPSTSYELYIRAVCNTTQTSNWNVAIPFITVLEIPTRCQIDIPLKDNGTETLLLDVPERGILGKDLFLESVDMIMLHDWPADMKITLESPGGQHLLLSNHNGTVFKHFGDINDEGCAKVTSFAPGACQNLNKGKPPYIGLFRPDGDIDIWKPDTLNGRFWKLIFTDRAIRDVGVLKYLNIKFSSTKCQVPEDITIKSVGVNFIQVAWKADGLCNTIKFLIKANGITQDAIFADCSKKEFIIKDLLPDTNYEISLSSVCSFDSQSPLSCPLMATTTCEVVSLNTRFDDEFICSEGCQSRCPLNNGVWYNSKTDSEQDWIIWQGKTDTENTGPSGDVNAIGKYLYLENNPTICGAGNAVVLQSGCMNIRSNSSGCDVSFYYHMYGTDIKSLKLEVSTDGEKTWQELFFVSGNKSDVWQKTTLSLANFAGQSGVFRFVGLSGDGPLADIALDQIEFFGTTLLDKPLIYYPDLDKDGYGTEFGAILTCQSDPPPGFSRKYGDCDDNNAFIHPMAEEIPCNAIDENCNGLEDDSPEGNTLFITAIKQNATCNGSADGFLALNIQGGNAPYMVHWNNGMTGAEIASLSQGIYYATVLDASNCLFRTSFFEIIAENQLSIISPTSDPPGCSGKMNGKIFIEHSTGNAPYTYQWSNGETTKNLINIPEGNYSVTVTDALNCSASLSNIELLPKPSIITDIKFIRHPLCFGNNNGQVELITVNGTLPYKYEWNTGVSSAVMGNLKAGTYTCTVTDLTGCKNVIVVKISDPPLLKSEVISIEDVRCFGEKNGSIKTNASGGRPPYTFLWNNFEFTDDIFNLPAGKYMLTITDANGCTASMPPVFVKQPGIFDIRVDSIEPARCISGNNGFVSLVSSGGNGGYNYVWNNTTQSSSFLHNIMSGNYSVTAYDKLGCKANIPNIFIPYVNDTLDIALNVLSTNKCYNDREGRIEVVVSKGQAVYDFNWNFGSQYFRNNSMDTINQLLPGHYVLTVTDANGCTGISDTVILKNLPPLLYQVGMLELNNCPYDSSGIIGLNLSGGTPPLTVHWNDLLSESKILTNLPNGTYDGFITDNNGCFEFILPLNITSVSNMAIQATILNATDHKGNGEICLSVSGGIPPYQYDWNIAGVNTNCVKNLSPGTYTVTVTDASTCRFSTIFVIENLTEVLTLQTNLFALYPNPASHEIFIKNNLKWQILDVADYAGNSVMGLICFADRNNEVILHVSELKPGLYFIKIQNIDNQYILRKFIKI